MRGFWSILLWLMLAGAVAAQDADARRIVVVGQGAVAAPPDAAVLRLGVESEAATAAEAMARLAADIADVIAALRDAGLAEGQVQTAQLQMYQRSDSSSLGSLPGSAVFVASSILTVTSPEMGAIGDLLDTAVTSGANRIDSVSFEVRDPSAALNAARRLAVADGMAKAALLAEAAGVELGDLMVMRDAPQGGGPGFGDVARMSVPVIPGQAELSVAIEMIFAING